MANSDIKCPVTGQPIFLEPAVLVSPAPTRFICPSCGRVHELHAIDHRAIDIGPAPEPDQENSN